LVTADDVTPTAKRYYLCSMSCFSSGVRTMCSGTSYTVTIITKIINNRK